MENPATWNETKKTIYEAIHDFDEEMKTGKCGSSLITVIYNKLKSKDLLKENSISV
jgi:hypothetical protein